MIIYDELKNKNNRSPMSTEDLLKVFEKFYIIRDKVKDVF